MKVYLFILIILIYISNANVLTLKSCDSNTTVNFKYYECYKIPNILTKVNLFPCISVDLYDIYNNTDNSLHIYTNDDNIHIYIFDDDNCITYLKHYELYKYNLLGFISVYKYNLNE